MVWTHQPLYSNKMIEDFFYSKIFPKFYIKTKNNQFFALGKKNKLEENCKIALFPIFTDDETFCGVYSPDQFYFSSNYEINDCQNFKVKPPINISNDIDYMSWQKLVEKTKTKIKNGVLKKAVLKRKTSFEFDQPIDPYKYFFRFIKNNPQVNHFLFQPDPSTTFFGGTPEHLFHRKNEKLRTMALAATIPKNYPIEKLYSDHKLRKEFQFVKDQLEELLKPFSSKITVSNNSLCHLKTMIHLKCDFEADLKFIDDIKLIETFHPTSAILGLPKMAAFKYVKENEPTARSYYASALGFITPNESEILVGIRSGIFKENLLHAFAGVGIVEESNPIEEWKELNLKLQPIKLW